MPTRNAEFYSQVYWPQKLDGYQLGRDAGTELRFVLREGYARKYLKLNGVWQDHVLTAYLSARD